MAKKSTTLLLSREYGLWLAANGINATSQSCYVMHDAEQTTQLPYFDIIASFLFHNERMYAYAVLEDWGKRTAGNKKNIATGKSTGSSYASS